MTNVQRHPATLPDDLTIFRLEKGRVRPLLIALLTLQQRDDLSGKFAKKLSRQRRAITRADEDVLAEQNDLLEIFTKKDGDGKPLPVYAETPEGKPIFKKDDKGNDTDERLVIPGRFQLTDAKEYEAGVKALVKETIVVECPCFKTSGGVPELELFKAVKGDIIDALVDLEEGAETTLTNEKHVAALRAAAARLEKKIADVEAKPSAIALVTDESPVAELAGAVEERSAP